MVDRYQDIRFSVIIPAFNAGGSLAKCIASIRSAEGDMEIIVVDGGSDDQTRIIAQVEKTVVCHTEKNRGMQLNLGARTATGNVLIFLHADTQLPSNAFEVIRDKFQDPRVQVGTFMMRFDDGHWLLNLYSSLTRFDSLWTSFGDQGIVTRGYLFKSLGGFSEWPLFEDVDFLRKVREKTKVYSLPAEVTTSADKFLKQGIVKHQLCNGALILKYLVGVSPEKLYRQYYS